jgi:serine/threonine protein kinase/Tfp pilus assembly protein PilF
MKCPKCSTKNPEDSKFCKECAAPLSSSKDISITKTLLSTTREIEKDTVIAKKYSIIEKLGEGGMGIVYKAEDTRLKRTVALKFLPAELTKDDEAKKRFIQEAQAAAALDHPNICTVYEVDEADNQIFISMAFIDGQTLKEKLGSAPLDIDEAKDITIQVSEGLKEAHDKGIVHRDIKPANILMTKKGQAKITDFGLAKLSWGMELTRPSMIMGTVAYMSPEQARGADIDFRTDIWSLGAMFYEMLSGEPPFQKSQERALIYAILNDNPTPLSMKRSEIPSKLEEVVDKALAKRKENRYQNAADLIQDLKFDSKTEAAKAQKSIAVLPFMNMSADPEQEYFCDGLSEDIINALTQIPDLRVVARTSAFSFKGKDIDIRNIGRKLDVNTVLEGSVRKAGNRLRITAQLIDVTDGYHLWSERFDRDMSDVFAIQDEITLAITDKLKLELLGDDMDRMIKRTTENFEAYNFYLRGLHFRRKLTKDGIQKSIEYFNKAIQIDPANALAYAGLAYSYMALVWYGPHPHKEVYPKAKKAALKALELDEQLAEVHESLCTVKAYLEWDWEGGKKEAQRMIELNPGYAWGYFHLSMITQYQGKLDESIALVEKALKLDPLNVAGHRNLGISYLHAGLLDKAEETLLRTIEMDPSFWYTYINLGYIYLQQNKHEEALAAIQKEQMPNKAILEPIIGVVYSRMGKKDEALKILKKYNEPASQGALSPYHLAVLCFELEENDLVFQWLEMGYEEHDPWMGYMNIDFLLDGVRDDKRFNALLKKIGLG